MSRVLVTGAAGNVGRQTIAALEDRHEVTPVTHREHDDLDSEILEITNYDAVARVVEGNDVIVHLAADPSPRASWDSIFHTNIGGTYNIYEAAATHDIDRIVFASTNHVTHMKNILDQDDHESIVSDPRRVRPDDSFYPDSYYAVSKITGEALGAYYAAYHDIEVVNQRIGWLLDESELQEKADGKKENVDYVKSMWLSPRDCREAMRQSVEETLPENPLTVNILSENQDRYLSLTEAICGLNYHPQDDSSDVI